jgi:argininosuccinate lyase
MSTITSTDLVDPFGRTGGKKEGILDLERREHFAQVAHHQIPQFVRVHQAWLVMLMRQGIVPSERGRKILRALGSVDRAAVDWMIETWQPSGWEPMIQLERYLTSQVGQIASDLNIGRTIPPPFYRMEILELLVPLIEATLSFRRILLSNASEHAETVMPGYTHLQHAQPMTYGHYLLGLYEAIDRASVQVEAVYSVTNRFELGCGALSGTSFPIDRCLVADLLGFDGLVEHSNDAVAATDFLIDLMGALTNLMIPLSRVAGEMDIWSSFEFGMVEIADHLTNPSSMMPQKKNPAVFEFCRMILAQVLAGYTEIVCGSHALPYGDVIEMRELSFAMLPRIREVTRQLENMGEAIDTLIVHKAIMLRRAWEGYSTVTELAALLYREAGVPLRLAHGIVGEVVRTMLADGKPSSEINVDIVEQAALKVAGEHLRLCPERLQAALDPVCFVEAHTSRGGVAPAEVRRMVAEREALLAEAEERQRARLSKIRAAEKELSLQVESLLKNG